MSARDIALALADAARVKRAHPDIETEPLFDLEAITGGRAVDETRSRKGKTHRPDREGVTCPRCGQTVQPGPHTRPATLGDPLTTTVTVCQEPR